VGRGYHGAREAASMGRVRGRGRGRWQQPPRERLHQQHAGAACSGAANAISTNGRSVRSIRFHRPSNDSSPSKLCCYSDMRHGWYAIDYRMSFGGGTASSSGKRRRLIPSAGPCPAQSCMTARPWAWLLASLQSACGWGTGRRRSPASRRRRLSHGCPCRPPASAAPPRVPPGAAPL